VASVTRPVRQLVGFRRLALAPGEARRVVFHLDPSQLAFVGPRLRWRVEPGRFAVEVGASSEDVRAEGSFEIVGAVRELDCSEILPTRTSLLPG
jgi:beta-glucosidase